MSEVISLFLPLLFFIPHSYFLVGLCAAAVGLLLLASPGFLALFFYSDSCAMRCDECGVLRWVVRRVPACLSVSGHAV